MFVIVAISIYYYVIRYKAKSKRFCISNTLKKWKKKKKIELKEIDNQNLTWYCFDVIVRVWDRDSDFSDILSDEKLYKENKESILICGFSYKNLTGAKLLRIRFNKIDGFIEINHEVKHLVLFDYGQFDKICNQIEYLISKKRGIPDSDNDSFARIRIDSYDSLPIEKIFTFHNVIIVSC